jgi:hypothetical protein
MEEYLRLLSEGQVDFSSLISRECPIEDAEKIFEELKSPQNKLLGVILTYQYKESSLALPEENVVRYQRKKSGTLGKIRVGVIGAGSFAKEVHLPNLKSYSKIFDIHAIADKNHVNAKECANIFGADYGTTDYRQILDDPDTDMVIIATRHHLHAKIAGEAAVAGKAVLLEKPMAMNMKELDELIKILRDTRVSFMVGFNRRFSPHAQKAKEIIGKHRNPVQSGQCPTASSGSLGLFRGRRWKNHRRILPYD